ncbi:activating signal cointegrator 1 complex subunit 3 [Hetaerina americana]|uniref:activating signal cointegrator 1 complex subunit 3 n=1 Tax=Hetaerina americana TaxID=62018 RepID=UPI003A7F53E8
MISCERPSFSRYLRNVAKLGISCGTDIDSVSLEKRKKWKEERAKTKVLWREVRDHLLKQSPPNSALKTKLERLRAFCKELAGEEDPEIIDDAALLMLKLFFEDKLVSNSKLSALKQVFGSINLQTGNRISNMVFEILSVLPDHSIEYVRNVFETNKHELKFNGAINSQNSFVGGTESVPEVLLIACSVAKTRRPVVPSNVVLTDMTLNRNETPSADFSMRYEDVVKKISEVNDVKKSVESAWIRKTGFGRAWLTQEVKAHFGNRNPAGLPVEEFSDTLITLITSEKSNDELQGELVGLLGFDQLKLAEVLMENRNDIVFTLALEAQEDKLKTAIQKMVQPKRPTFGCQVLVQSEEERTLKKQVRKEEKKILKVAKDIKENEETEIDFNPIELRKKRRAALLAANKPIFREKNYNSVRRVPADVYPHVYDSMSKAKLSSGYIAGAKLVLPENMERSDNKVYEEVTIPVSDAAPVDVGNKRVAISTLDEIGQMAFQGIKSLNRIQSVVFDAAYHTNENLLICAPTGAGKTNVALLTVLYAIRQFIEDGVIRKDQFKVVYVAPMKALAAEMTRSFGSRLGALGLTVKELTGDMQLTKNEIMQTQMLVTTPEKWDVVTRKATGDVALTSLVKLLIIDEVHLLHGDRGPVVEALVARTLRLVESSQSMIRIVGLSATLPNYLDVARFLRVNPYMGLFYFDARFRPVPLGTTFIGVKSIKPLQQMQDMDSVCYDKVIEMVQKGHQVMVFVHARNATARTAMVLRETAQQKGQLGTFECQGDSNAASNSSTGFGLALKTISKSRNKQLVELFSSGFAIHHAGMLRADRSLVEKYFQEGFIKVLVCTSTLAWGVNLPAHAVIIKGTSIYDAKHGSFVDMGILDVLQIFGRAGRPQYDSSGHGTIITTHDKLSHYLSLLTNQFPIESNFLASLADNLNAEVALGTISNLDEAVEWLSYTYLYERMKINPQVYGINYNDVSEDPTLEKKCREFIQTAARALDKAHMIRFNERTGDMNITDLGRTASHFYIKYDTVEIFNDLMKPLMTDRDILSMVSQAQEFEQLKVRDDELTELDDLTRGSCQVPVAGGSENIHGKVNILLQTYLSRGRIQSFSLMSDTSYISQNAGRIVRALFEIVLRKNNPILAGRFLTMGKMFEQQLWDFQSPMRQFICLPFEILQKIEDRRLTIDRLREMDHREIGSMLRHPKMGEIVKKCAEEFPLLDMEENMQPITRTVLRIRLTVRANFRWNDKVHGKTSQSFWIWIEDPDSNFMYHHEYFIITRKQVIKNEAQELVMTIPLVEPLPPQYYVRAISDHWLGSEVYVPLTFQHLILPETHPPHTDLLSLQPLPVKALGNDKLVSLYKYSHFNPVQTQIFHCLYHTDVNVLLGAPTGSGKTVAAEIAMFRVFREYPGTKVVYIAPLKSLVRERIEDWKLRLTEKLGISVVELTGDASPDARAMANADVVVTTPEKWDGVSRSWSTRAYVRNVSLIVIDEIHLLGEERGPVLEIIVSRANYIASHGSQQANSVDQGASKRGRGVKPYLHPGRMRIIGLSTALANARDLADWLGIAAGSTGALGLYNFRPSVRPVPLEVHISGFPGKHYCPRMATMNRPAFQAIRQHSPGRPTLIFVSSRRQTRLTALDLISCLAGEENPKQWLHCAESEIETISATVADPNLRLTLAFGIGLHHAGLTEHDRRTVERLFSDEKIQVLIATATLAWGVNLPAHLVIIKGTEYYDGKTNRYADMPVTDVLQMMGRAGRPQFDKNGIAVVFVHDAKKDFYKKFLYEPFPVESGLHKSLPDHVGAEVVGGIIKTKQEALDYLTWTYFFRRLMRNPVYYGLGSLEPADINYYLSSLVEETVSALEEAGCLKVDEDGRTLIPTSMGQIASYYYLSHNTMRHFQNALQPTLDIQELLVALCDVTEYDQLPVRHNEDILNGELAKMCPKPVDLAFDSPHAKAQLLFQAHFSRLVLPCADYYTDLKSVLDQAIRILQAMIDVCAENGWLPVTLRSIQLMQMVMQGRWIEDDPLTTLPHIEPMHLRLLYSPRKGEVGEAGPLTPVFSLPELKVLCRKRGYAALADLLRVDLDENQIEEIYQVVCDMPAPSIELSVRGWWSPSSKTFANEIEDSEEVEEEKKFPQPPSRQGQWVDVHADQEYTLVIRFGRLSSVGLRIGSGRGGRGRGRGASMSSVRGNGEMGRAHCPRYHKPKDEGWFLILGDVERGEVLALKRATGCGRPWGGGGGGTMQQLSFRTPSKTGRLILTVYIMSDCYIGWDQQYDIHLNVIESSIKSQVNTELSENEQFTQNVSFNSEETEDSETSNYHKRWNQ